MSNWRLNQYYVVLLMLLVITSATSFLVLQPLSRRRLTSVSETLLVHVSLQFTQNTSQWSHSIPFRLASHYQDSGCEFP